MVQLRSTRPRRGSPVAALALVGLSIVLALSPPLRAVEKMSEQVVSFAGAQTASVPIEVPAFHGIEPRLALAYSSEGRNGFVGVGWSIAGFSAIERHNPGLGAPRYDASDVFVLDGEELVVCAYAAASSPSCATGGTHTSKNESYRRIRRDALTDTFSIVDRSGVETRYAPTLTTPSGTFRWGVSEVRDRSGNVVTYRWGVVGGDAYPEQVLYGPYSVSFFREARPDALSFATGASLGRTIYRLKSAIVYLPGVAHVRGYQLSYTASPSTGRSLLASVRQVGKDLVHDGAGTFTGGTFLPARSFTYQEDALALGFHPAAAPPASSPGTTEPVNWALLDGTRIVPATHGLEKTAGPSGAGTFGDAGASSSRALASGAGFLEITSTERYTWGKIAGLSHGDDDLSAEDVDFGLYLYYDNKVYAIENGTLHGPFDRADGDLLRVEVSAAGVVSYKRNGATFYTSANAPTYPLLVDAAIRTRGSVIEGATLSGTLVDIGPWCSGRELLAADVDGDGRTDELCWDVGDRDVEVRLARLDGFAQPALWLASLPAGFETLLPGDFDNDGRADLGMFGTWSADFAVALSTGSGFATPTVWGNGSGTTSGGSAISCKANQAVAGVGDFNGDGKTDVSCRHANSPLPSGPTEILVGLSTGSSFQFSDWGNLGCDANVYQVTGAIDFDGDGKDDWLCEGSTNGNLQVYVSTGNSFVAPAFGSLDASFCGASSAGHLLGDWNGDGRTDVACRGNGKVALSTGRAFDIQGSYGSFCVGSEETTQAFALDVDGDGASELVCNHDGAGATDVEVRKWSNGALAPAATWLASWCEGTAVAGDFDGDGKGDLACDRTATPALAGSSGVRTDLLARDVSPLGGAVEIAYRPSTDFTSTNNPPVRPVVVETVARDGRGGVATDRYTYAGALMDRVERRFRGFRWVQHTKPCLPGESACPYRETWFRQDDPTGARPERIDDRDGAGHLYQVEIREYEVSAATLPRTSILTGEWQIEASGSFASVGCSNWPCAYAKRTRTTHAYDAYGNEVQRIELGDHETAGDERTTEWLYRPNTAAFVVDRPALERLRAGAGSTGAILRETRYLYDGAATWDQAPSRGLVTREERWLDATGGYVTRGFAYDAWGNRTSSTSATGGTTAVTFDATDHLFPVASTIPTGETTSLTWDRVCGVPATSTDANGQVTTAATDALCRPARVDRPLGDFRVYSYVATGDPTAQYTGFQSPPAAGSEPFETRIYRDGFGRTWREARPGPAAGQWIVSDTTYGARGQVASRTAPYFSDATGTPPRTTLAYDAVDRPVTERLPDQALRTWSYPPRAIVETDPLNRERTTRYDAFGRKVSEEAEIAGRTLVTASTWNLRDQLTGLTDPAGNAWAWTIDSLGRIAAIDDPDSGHTAYEYDASGRPTARTDAKGQRIDYLYDASGRLTRRTAPDEVVTFTYGEARPGFLNAGRLTTVADPSGTLRHDFDAAGRQVRAERTLDFAKGAPTYTLLRRYDAAGRSRGVTYPDGDQVGTPAVPLGYDRAGNLTSIPGIVDAITWDAAGRPLVVANANGSTTTRSWSSARGWLDAIETSSNAAGTFQDASYTHDAAGRTTGSASPFAAESWSYDFDDLDRLVSAFDLADPAHHQTYQYDDAGNKTWDSRIGALVYPAPGSPRPHAPLTVAGGPMSYDGNGNLLAGRGRSFQWTAANQPRLVNGVEFVYDGLGRRLQKVSPTGTVTTPFGDDLEVAGGVVTKVFRVSGLGVVAKRVGATTRWLHVERQGSVQAVTSAAGAVVERKAYRPYGGSIAGGGEPLGYIGERLDAETGLLDLHARAYDPEFGLFTAPDPSHPAGPGVGTNRYAYAFGNPIDHTDPSGLSCTQVGNQVYCSGYDVVVGSGSSGGVPYIIWYWIQTGILPWSLPILPTVGPIPVPPPTPPATPDPPAAPEPPTTPDPPATTDPTPDTKPADPPAEPKKEEAEKPRGPKTKIVHSRGEIWEIPCQPGECEPDPYEVQSHRPTIDSAFACSGAALACAALAPETGGLSLLGCALTVGGCGEMLRREWEDIRFVPRPTPAPTPAPTPSPRR